VSPNSARWSQAVRGQPHGAPALAGTKPLLSDALRADDRLGQQKRIAV
jgi:hypothetical protein